MPTLEEIKHQTVNQALRKDWYAETDWLIEKLNEEWKELQYAIAMRASPQAISEEFADMIIVLTQIMEKECPQINLDDAWYDKLLDNYFKKKKTLDPQTGEITKK